MIADIGAVPSVIGLDRLSLVLSDFDELGPGRTRLLRPVGIDSIRVVTRTGFYKNAARLQ